MSVFRRDDTLVFGPYGNPVNVTSAGQHTAPSGHAAPSNKRDHAAELKAAHDDYNKRMADADRAAAEKLRAEHDDKMKQLLEKQAAKKEEASSQQAHGIQKAHLQNSTDRVMQARKALGKVRYCFSFIFSLFTSLTNVVLRVQNTIEGVVSSTRSGKVRREPHILARAFHRAFTTVSTSAGSANLLCKGVLVDSESELHRNLLRNGGHTLGNHKGVIVDFHEYLKHEKDDILKHNIPASLVNACTLPVTEMVGMYDTKEVKNEFDHPPGGHRDTQWTDHIHDSYTHCLKGNYAYNCVDEIKKQGGS